jgi:hypothetical protein
MALLSGRDMMLLTQNGVIGNFEANLPIT